VLRPKNLICIVLSELDKESAARFGLEYFARVRDTHLHHKSSLSFTRRLPRTLELMAARSSTKMQGIRTSILTHYPRSAGGPSQRLPHRAPFQHHHSIPTNLETLLLSTKTTTILSCLVDPRPKDLRDHGQAKPTSTRTGFRNNGGGSSGAQS
jgi:hypothetical protein